jgi:hypothetical protein
MQVDKDAFELAISKIDDGNIFELFGIDFLAAVFGYEFIPVGRSKDKGVDAFRHILARKDNEKQIFQLSTELDHEGKIIDTIKKLKDNEVALNRLMYATNRKINNAEAFVDKVYEESGVLVTIMDIRWFSAHSNESEKTIRAYQIFVDTYLHEYSKPGQYQTVANLDSDSRLYVFLGQQFDSTRRDLKLDDLLADTLILYSLEGTDPDKSIFKSREEINSSIKKYLKLILNCLNRQ